MVRHIFENAMPNGDVIHLDGTFRMPHGRVSMWLPQAPDGATQG